MYMVHSTYCASTCTCGGGGGGCACAVSAVFGSLTVKATFRPTALLQGVLGTLIIDPDGKVLDQELNVRSQPCCSYEAASELAMVANDLPPYVYSESPTNAGQFLPR